MHKISIANFSELKPLEPTYALVGNVDLVITRFSEREEVSVLYA